MWSRPTTPSGEWQQGIQPHPTQLDTSSAHFSDFDGFPPYFLLAPWTSVRGEGAAMSDVEPTQHTLWRVAARCSGIQPPSNPT
jgi:hypothetical protein